MNRDNRDRSASRGTCHAPHFRLCSIRSDCLQHLHPRQTPISEDVIDEVVRFVSYGCSNAWHLHEREPLRLCLLVSALRECARRRRSLSWSRVWIAQNRRSARSSSCTGHFGGGSVLRERACCGGAFRRRRGRIRKHLGCFRCRRFAGLSCHRGTPERVTRIDSETEEKPQERHILQALRIAVFGLWTYPIMGSRLRVLDMPEYIP